MTGTTPRARTRLHGGEQVLLLLGEAVPGNDQLDGHDVDDEEHLRGRVRGAHKLTSLPRSALMPPTGMWGIELKRHAG